MHGAAFFSPDYPTARDRFRHAAAGAGATLHALDLTACGPAGEPLTIDIAWLGERSARAVFLHTTGLHGIEAFTGSAAQLALLAQPPEVPAGSACVLVHVLNPYGMTWLRRTNEENVDLNRNFLEPDDAYAGAPPLYARLDPLLNPRSAPRNDGFAWRAAAAALRYGFHRVKQAIAEGQYEYPQGLFFGGRRLQEGPQRWNDWLVQNLGSAEYILALDLHTGLGRRGTDTVIPEAPNVTAIDVLARALERRMIDVSRKSVAYSVRGGWGGALPRLLPQARLDCVLQEIGTEGPFRVLHALREENRWHFHGGGELRHPAKARLLEALCPSDPRWRETAVALSTSLARNAARRAFRGDQLP